MLRPSDCLKCGAEDFLDTRGLCSSCASLKGCPKCGVSEDKLEIFEGVIACHVCSHIASGSAFKRKDFL